MAKKSQNLYPKTSVNVNLPEIEQKVIQFWNDDNTFKKSVKGNTNFNFYDGPPFANGLPHYGHLLTGFIKDIYARFQTQCGKKVERRFGWDCHGLPAEMATEKELGISGKLAIEEYGIDKFNEHCKSSVLKYTQQWQDYVTRQARWVDFENDYKTMNLDYMESVIWAFEQLYKKGLVYESYRVMPYSWACETPVSDFETRMDNAYRQKVSQALTVKFKLQQSIVASNEDCYLLIWTTTPWTLPSNLSAAIGQDIEYVLIKKDTEVLILAKQLLSKYENIIGNDVIKIITGHELIGLKYIPPFDYFINHKNAFKILPADFVNIEDGTGIVHIAPGFGEDDQNLCKANQIETVCPVDSQGKFTHPITDFEGMQVFEANEPITRLLKSRKLLIKSEQYIHNYPHCWRTDTPLIYKAMPSWYIEVTKIKQRMVDHNQQINWVPNHIKNGMFGKWLENARDWSISRNRYWGCPIPIWRSDDPKYPNIEVYGSIEQLEEAFNVKVISLHRPFIDSLTRPNSKDPSGKSMMRRVPDVLDCWFESGSMPFAQVHYPFENVKWFEQNFPADFITEYQAQTRGWFYTLIVLSTALFDKPPFLNCICHGVLLGDDGQKLSKRLKNYPDPSYVFNEMGADAMRWFMASSPVMRGQELIMSQNGIKEALKNAIKPIWNAYNFFTLYANSDQISANFDLLSEYTLDRYILSKCYSIVAIVFEALQNYDSIAACKAIEGFFETLNNWYIRRSRERFWKTSKDTDKIQAYNTLYTVLIIICKSAASLMPMILENIYLGLTNSDKSVHLQLYPGLNEYKIDQDLINQMERIRSACTSALSLRNEMGIKVRQPLSKVIFIGVADNNFGDELKQLVLDEINVKQWVNLDQSQITKYADYKLQIHFANLGKRLPHKVKDIIAAQKNDVWQLNNQTLTIADQILLDTEYNLLLEPKTEFKDSIAALPSGDALVWLDLDITEELKFEGIARDLIRGIQQARKDKNLELTDQITIYLDAGNHVLDKVILIFKDFIKSQTLATEIFETLSAANASLLNDNTSSTFIEIDDAKIFYTIKKN